MFIKDKDLKIGFPDFLNFLIDILLKQKKSEITPLKKNLQKGNFRKTGPF